MSDPTAGGGDTSEDSGSLSNGYTIEIKVGGDGKISVGVEPNAEEAAEEGGEDGAEGGDDMQPVGSFKEAMKLANDIYTHAGNIQASGAGASDMSSGYGGGE
jgi:hypothetical protein